MSCGCGGCGSVRFGFVRCGFARYVVLSLWYYLLIGLVVLVVVCSWFVAEIINLRENYGSYCLTAEVDCGCDFCAVDCSGDCVSFCFVV